MAAADTLTKDGTAAFENELSAFREVRKVIEELRANAAKIPVEFQAVTKPCVELLEENRNFMEKHCQSLETLMTKLEKCGVDVCDKAGVEPVEHDDPYVVVLIDGSSFNRQLKEEYIRCDSGGGGEVAQHLSIAVQEYISSVPEIPRGSRVVVRIIANLEAVSPTAGRARLVDRNNAAPALAPFSSSFNEAGPFFDFIDMGKYSCKIKVAGNFWEYYKDSQCKHIIFGAAFAPAYVDALNKVEKKDGKVVLLRLGRMDQEYEQLGMKVIEFPKIFRSSDQSEVSSAMSAPVISPDRAGALRKFNPDGSTYAQGVQKKINASKENPYNLPVSGPPGLIPINNANERIDLLIQFPGSGIMSSYYHRFKAKKPCAAYHLHHGCNRPSCTFDHTPLDAIDIQCLKFTFKIYPCKRGTQCRAANCLYGHMCQKGRCIGRKSSGCSMPSWSHSKNTKIAKWVVGEVGRCSSVASGTRTGTSTDSGSGSVGFYNTTKSVITNDLIDLSEDI